MFFCHETGFLGICPLCVYICSVWSSENRFVLPRKTKTVVSMFFLEKRMLLLPCRRFLNKPSKIEFDKRILCSLRTVSPLNFYEHSNGNSQQQKVISSVICRCFSSIHFLLVFVELSVWISSIQLGFSILFISIFAKQENSSNS